MRAHKITLSAAIAAVLFAPCLISIAGTSDFETYKRQQQQGLQTYNNAFEQYNSELKEAYNAYKKKTARIWGKYNVLPDKTNWVLYQNDTNQRSIVNFEEGTIDVEIALPKDTRRNEDQIKETLKNNIQALLNQREDTRSIFKLAQQPAIKPNSSNDNNKKDPVLYGLIANDKGNEVTPHDYEALASELADKASKKSIRGADGKMRIVYETQFKMVPDHIKKRATKYQKMVNANAAAHNLRPELIFAVIETESWFNPTARSAAPAFGLMQLVPKSGARDAYKFLYNKDRVVTDTYLYNADNNIKLGSAYLRILYYKYLKGIKSDESRLWASIAAYNTGTGNVYRAFVGKYSRSKFGSRGKWEAAALREINRRSPEQVYQHMRRHLPYEEPRNYIKKVRTKMKKYTTA